MESCSPVRLSSSELDKMHWSGFHLICPIIHSVKEAAYSNGYEEVAPDLCKALIECQKGIHSGLRLSCIICLHAQGDVMFETRCHPGVIPKRNFSNFKIGNVSAMTDVR